jgi:hypothetical protein
MDTHIENIECEKCGKIFEYKYLLNRHLLNKIICNTSSKINKIYNEKINNIDDKIKKIDIETLDSQTKCGYCNSIFMNINNLKKHMQLCIHRQTLYNNKSNLLNERNSKLKNASDYTSNNNTSNNNTFNNNTSNNNTSNNNTSNNNTSNNNTSNNTLLTKDDINFIIDNQLIIKKILDNKLFFEQLFTSNLTHNKLNIDDKNKKDDIIINNNIINNNLKLNTFGNEDLSHISDATYKDYLINSFYGLLQYIKDVHFSKDMLTNHNISITDLNSVKINIYNKDNWIEKDKYSFLNKLISNKITLLDKKCDELENKKILTKHYIDIYNTFVNNYYKSSDDIKKIYHDKIALLIFNNT